MSPAGWSIGGMAAAALALAPAAGAETLAEAWALADAQDNGLAAVRSQAEAAEFDAGAARGQRWPTLAVGGAYTRLDDAPAFDFGFTGLPIAAPELFGGDDFWMGAATLTMPLLHQRADLLEHRGGRGARTGRRCAGPWRPGGRQARGRRGLRRRAACAQGARGRREQHRRRSSRWRAT